MAQIHPSSIVHPDAVLAADVVVGPFCLVGPKVRIGAGTHLRSHVCVEGRTTIGSGNVIYAGAIRRTRSMRARTRCSSWATTT